MSAAGSTRRVQKELKELTDQPLEGVDVHVDGDNLLTWKVKLDGPSDSPYVGGKFTVDVVFGTDFPFKAPTITFATKMYHPNIDSDGNICMGVIKADGWKPSTKMANVLLSVRDLLQNPNPDDPLVTSIAEQYRTDRPAFDKKAQEYVQTYAK